VFHARQNARDAPPESCRCGRPPIISSAYFRSIIRQPAYDEPMSRVGRNDPCHCQSGRKYKKCCLQIDETRDERSWAARYSSTLKEKNLTLINGMGEIFGLERDWSKVKEGMTDARIREFYRLIADLWPIDTDSAIVLPAPDSTLRALYLGENEPELMLQNVFRFCLYSDQIILVNPFDNPNVMADKFNPILHPGEWRIQTLRVVFHLMLLAPWIDAGLVVLVPDPGDFDRQLRVKTWNLATERLRGWSPSDEDMEHSLIRERTQNVLFLAPRDYLERTIRESDPELSDDRVRDLVDYIEKERAANPLLPNETLDKMPGQYTATRMGANLEMGMYICHATGAFPYTNVKFRWDEILRAQQLDANARVWSPLTKAFQQLTFKFLDKVDSNFACSLRKDGRLEGFRSYLRKVWHAVEGGSDASKSETAARDFSDELKQAYNDAEAEWKGIDRDLLKWAVPKLGGAALAGGRFSPLFAAGGFVLAGVSEIIQAEMKRRAFRQKVPMSVFIDLDQK
jgi:hypothetical protein